MCKVKKENLCTECIVLVVVRYPFDEAAVVGISTIKEFANDFKEVMVASLLHIVHTSMDSMQ